MLCRCYSDTVKKFSLLCVHIEEQYGCLRNLCDGHTTGDGGGNGRSSSHTRHLMVVIIAKIICEAPMKSNAKEMKEMLVTKCVDTTKS